jgi:hypothetical protein
MQLSDLQARIYRRLGENPASPQWWTVQEATNALNWAQRLFVLLTLCIEDQREWTLTPGVQHYHMLLDPMFPDWLMPLRVRLSNNLSMQASADPDDPQGDTAMPNAQLIQVPPKSSMPKLFPSRMIDFDSLSQTWRTDVGTPTRYAHLGADLMVFNTSTAVPADPGNGTLPPANAISLLLTFARVPNDMILPTDTPEIPDVDQPALADFAIVLMRLKDGGQEMGKAQALLQRFASAAKRRSDQVRARSIAEQYDNVPFEVERFDWSRVLGRRENLPPSKRTL